MMRPKTKRQRTTRVGTGTAGQATNRMTVSILPKNQMLLAQVKKSSAGAFVRPMGIATLIILRQLHDHLAFHWLAGFQRTTISRLPRLDDFEVRRSIAPAVHPDPQPPLHDVGSAIETRYRFPFQSITCGCVSGASPATRLLRFFT